MDNYVGEIKMFAGNYAPEGWLICDGSTLPIQGNEPLFSLIGTIYGGDGQKNFKIPDLRENVVVSKGQQGNTTYATGFKGGANTVTLKYDNMPPHNHPINAYLDTATSSSPGGNNVLAVTVPQGAGYSDAKLYSTLPSGTSAPDSPLDPVAVTVAGGSTEHNNLMPYVTISYIIAKAGEYPSQV